MVQSMGKNNAVDFVFLYPPHPYDVNPGAQIGLGLLLLATYARDLGASVRVINAQSMTVDQVINWIPTCKYLMMYGCLIDKPTISEILNDFGRRTRNFSVVGGPIAKSHNDTIRTYYVDGFGEDLIKDLVLNKYHYGPDVNRLKYNINHYPFPDRTLVEGGPGGNIFKRGTDLCRVSTTLLTSRGCRYRCAFCTSGQEDFFEEYDLSRIEKELEHCLSLGIRNIRISDDNLVSDLGRLNNLCAILKEAKVNWRGSIRVKPNDPEIYQMMADSGCKELSFGVESGDSNVLKLLNKGILTTQSIKAIRNAKKAGILTRALMMMGTPGETKETVYHNMSWVDAAKPDMVSLKMFVPYPGTDIYHNPQKYKCKIHLPLEEVNNSAYRPDGSQPKANIDSEELSKEELTWQFLKMKSYLETRGIENRG